MRERLYLAGCPSTPQGWIGFGLAMLVGTVGTYILGGMPILTLIFLSWLINLATVYWSLQNRLICQLALWILLWRANSPDLPWYLVGPVAVLLAGTETWVKEQRRMESGPVG